MEDFSIGIVGGIFFLAIIIFYFASVWIIFEKAGKPGWAAIIPIYNMIVLLEIIGKPLWWIILMFIPFVNLIILILVYIELAQRFGKSTLFGLGLVFLSFIFIPLLAFGDARYEGRGPNDPNVLDSGF